MWVYILDEEGLELCVTGKKKDAVLPLAVQQMKPHRLQIAFKKIIKLVGKKSLKLLSNFSKVCCHHALCAVTKDHTATLAQLQPVQPRSKLLEGATKPHLIAGRFERRALNAAE